ncbi:MAG: Holliday junction branch migration protein RuvA [Patescibacteria group bacterium]
MISSIRGTTVAKTATSVHIQTSGGVGYEISLTPLHAAKLVLNKEAELPTYLRVTESALDLFGFQNDEERGFFILLISVSGVGPKTALNILSLGSLSEIKSAIARGDAKYLSAVKGIGRKTAERLCVELKSKITRHEAYSTTQTNGGVLSEVIDGLVALGYSREEAREAVAGVESEGKTTEGILREVLKNKK